MKRIARCLSAFGNSPLRAYFAFFGRFGRNLGPTIVFREPLPVKSGDFELVDVIVSSTDRVSTTVSTILIAIDLL